jgi:hypothetical protein
MARGYKYSQAFFNGGQYDFAGRFLAGASENNQSQKSNAEKASGGNKVSALGERQYVVTTKLQTRNETGLTTVLLEATNGEKSVLSSKVGQGAEAINTNAERAVSSSKNNANATVFTTEVANQRAYNKTSQTAESQSTIAVKVVAIIRSAIAALVEKSTSGRIYASVKSSQNSERQNVETANQHGYVMTDNNRSVDPEAIYSSISGGNGLSGAVSSGATQFYSDASAIGDYYGKVVRFSNGNAYVDIPVVRIGYSTLIHTGDPFTTYYLASPVPTVNGQSSWTSAGFYGGYADNNVVSYRGISTEATAGAQAHGYNTVDAEPYLVESQEVSRTANFPRTSEVSEILSQKNNKVYSSVKDGETAEIQATNAPKARTVTETNATALVESTVGSKSRNIFEGAIATLVEKVTGYKIAVYLVASETTETQATVGSKSRSTSKYGTDALTQKTENVKSLSSVRSAIGALVEKATSTRSVSASRSGIDVLVENANGLQYYFKYTAPITFLFGSRPANPFTTPNTGEAFANPTVTAYTTGVSSETFQEDGVSSYEDGQ